MSSLSSAGVLSISDTTMDTPPVTQFQEPLATSFEIVIETKKASPIASGDVDCEQTIANGDHHLITAGDQTEVKIEMEEQAPGVKVEPAEEEEEIVPDHYHGGGKIPVFKPVSISSHLLLCFN